MESSKLQVVLPTVSVACTVTGKVTAADELSRYPHFELSFLCNVAPQSERQYFLRTETKVP